MSASVLYRQRTSQKMLLSCTNQLRDQEDANSDILNTTECHSENYCAPMRSNGPSISAVRLELTGVSVFVCVHVRVLTVWHSFNLCGNSLK